MCNELSTKLIIVALILKVKRNNLNVLQLKATEIMVHPQNGNIYIKKNERVLFYTATEKSQTYVVK